MTFGVELYPKPNLQTNETVCKWFQQYSETKSYATSCGLQMGIDTNLEYKLILNHGKCPICSKSIVLVQKSKRDLNMYDEIFLKHIKITDRCSNSLTNQTKEN